MWFIALKAARTEHIRKLIDNNQKNPRFLFSTVARLTNNQTSPDINIPSQFNSNDFMNFFTDKIDNIRNTITNVGSTASSTSASFTAPKEKLLCFTTIGREELNKRITASKPTTCLLDPVPTKLLRELSPGVRSSYVANSVSWICLLTISLDLGSFGSSKLILDLLS